MSEKYSLQTPLTNEVVEKLSAGTRVLLNGAIYTARDAAHKRLFELVQEGKELPFDVQGAVIYYVGPTPPKPGEVIGSAGPTSSYRMDVYTLVLLERGLKGMIGKGARGQEIKAGLKKYRAVYFAATGGAGALIAQSIIQADIVAYEDLGTEAIRRLVVQDFPAIVVNDVHGNDLFEQGRTEFQQV